LVGSDEWEAAVNVGVIAGVLTLAVLSGGRALEAQEQFPSAASSTQGSGGSPAPPAQAPGQVITDTIEAGEAEAKEPARSLVAWNHYEGPFFTIRLVEASARLRGVQAGREQLAAV
jgi:hypothetical protein